MTAPRLPTGTVAFLFTDIEGSTKRWEAHGPTMGIAVTRHDALLRQAIEAHGGVVFKTVGDAFCAAFGTVPPAVAAALAAQRALEGEAWGQTGPLRARMAVHAGAAEARAGDYAGPAVERAGRLLSAGHGGQVLVSRAAEQLVGEAPPGGVALRDLGEHRLKDLGRPERVFQLVAPDLPADFPALATLDARPNNLPSQLTPLVGREQEVASVAEFLGRPGARLVTLTGPGGTGKTRLSLQVAADVIDDYPGGTWCVELEETTDEDAVVAAVATALGVREAAGQTLGETLVAFLTPKRLLLVLDNFEQVVHAAPLIGKLLQAAPGVAALVTSRVRLGLSGELAYAVPPLTVPPEEARRADPEDLGRYEAVRLFVERAGAAQAGFALTADNAAAVAQICRQLDGLPLAIELAAARVKLLPPPALLKRLEDTLGLLVSRERDRTARQQTLRGAIAWSHDLLAPAEQALFARLSVFAGGFDLAAGEAVANPGGELDLFAALAALVDHSLVWQEETAEGDARFGMLATIRAFAREQLEAAGGGEAELTRMLHAAHFLGFAETAEPHLIGREQAAWLERLEAELDNMRAALAWATGRGEGDTALRLAGALFLYWTIRGHVAEGREWLERALTLAPAATPAVRAQAHFALGFLTLATGDAERAAALGAESLAIARADGDRLRAARALYLLGAAAEFAGDLPAATARYEESIAAYRALNDDSGVGHVLNALAGLALRRGDAERATALAGEALTLNRAAAYPWGEGQALYTLGRGRGMLGDMGAAAEALHDSLGTLAEIGDAWYLALPLAALARAAAEARRYDEAARLIGATERLRPLSGAPVWRQAEPDLRHAAGIARARLGEERFAALRGEGRALATPEAVAIAFRLGPANPAKPPHWRA